MLGKQHFNSSSSCGNPKKLRSIKDALLGNSKQIHKSLQAQHKGKRPLLTAMSIYQTKSKIPEGEETYNFLYRIKVINPDGLICTNEYEERYFEDVGKSFRSYPALEDSDTFIENYRVALIREDNELFKKYQGAINKHANDICATQKKAVTVQDQQFSKHDLLSGDFLTLNCDF
jgi:hypothetical protein